MTVYPYNELGVFIGSAESDHCPAFATTTPPPDPDHGCVVLFVSGQWRQIKIPDPTSEDLDALALANVQRIQTEIVAAVQSRLDDFARTKNYDGILSLCTYASSTNPAFAAEGQTGVDLRDATWTKLYQILGEVQDGAHAVPTCFADIEAEFPVLEW